MNNAGTSLEANLSAGQQPGSPAWWGGTNVFENYGPLTVAEWNGGNTPSWRAASVLQWTLNGFVNSGDTMGTVNSASFTIMGKQAGGNTYRVYRLQAPIDGATTWNTKPLLDASAFVEFTMAADYALQTVDVSSLRLWNCGPPSQRKRRRQFLVHCLWHRMACLWQPKQAECRLQCDCPRHHQRGDIDGGQPVGR
jgi:hypothetical protein